MAIAPYTWKSTQELQQKNQANTMANAMQGAGAPAPVAAPSPNPSAPAPGAMPAPAPSAGVTPFAVPKTMAEAMRQPTIGSNMALAQKNIAEGFQPAPAGPADDLARNELQKTLDANQRSTLEQSALSGRARTGQIGGDLVNYLTQSAVPQKADLEGHLQANRMANDTQRAQNAQGNLLNLANLEQSGDLAREQMGLTERTSMADIASREKLGLAGIASQEGMQAKDIASKEKLGFADLSLRERQLAQEGSQFKDELSFKKYATDRGYTDAEAQRAWQSQENALQRASTEKVSFAQLSQQEKELAQQAMQFQDKLAWDKQATKLGLDDKAADRVWQGAENQKERDARAQDSNLNRELQKYLGDRGLDLDEQKIAENIRQFNNEQDFKKWATQAGLDDNAADRVWKSNEADVQRKYETGERLSTEEHQVNLTRLQGEIDQAKSQADHLLNLDTMDKQAAIDKITAETANGYQVARDSAAMTHDEAMEKLKADLTGKLQEAGYDHETAMQAATLKAEAFQKDQDRQAAKLEAQAELAYKYKALADQTGLSQQEIENRKTEVQNQLSLGLQQLGLDKAKFDQTVKDQDFQDRAGVLSTMLEMGGNNPDVADRAAAGFLTLLKEKGLITPEDYTKGVAGIGATRTKTTADTAAIKSAAGNAMYDAGSPVINGIKSTADAIANGVADGVTGTTHAAANGVRKLGSLVSGLF